MLHKETRKNLRAIKWSIATRLKCAVVDVRVSLDTMREEITATAMTHDPVRKLASRRRHWIPSNSYRESHASPMMLEVRFPISRMDAMTETRKTSRADHVPSMEVMLFMISFWCVVSGAAQRTRQATILMIGVTSAKA